MGSVSRAVFDLSVTVKFDDDLPNGPYAAQTTPMAVDCFILPGSTVIDVKAAVEKYAATTLSNQMQSLPGSVSGSFTWTITGMSFKGGEIADPNIPAKEGKDKGLIESHTIEIRRKMVLLELFFDYSSPWTYLAFSQVRRLMKTPGVNMKFKPILVGGVFNAVNPSVYEARKAKPVIPKVTYMNQDLQEWAEAYGIKIRGPYEFDPKDRVSPFPVNSIKSLRGAEFAQRQGKLLEYSDVVFKSYWSDSKDISQDDVMEEIVKSVGLPWKEFQAFIQSDEAKKIVRDNTEELVQRGGFGSPTFFVNNKYMYFGNDRLPLLERRLQLESKL